MTVGELRALLDSMRLEGLKDDSKVIVFVENDGGNEEPATMSMSLSWLASGKPILVVDVELGSAAPAHILEPES